MEYRGEGRGRQHSSADRAARSHSRSSAHVDAAIAHRRSVSTEDASGDERTTGVRDCRRQGRTQNKTIRGSKSSVPGSTAARWTDATRQYENGKRRPRGERSTRLEFHTGTVSTIGPAGH